MPRNPYRLPAAYRRNLHPVDFDDHAPIVGACAGWEWQPDVYPFATAQAEELGAKVIIDVGCGAARKLLPFADEFTVVGIDRAPIVEQITEPGHWLAHDLEQPVSLPYGVLGEPAVWVCSDVIEHLVHPEHVIAALAERLAEAPSVLVLSTPDRIRTRGPRHRGPSPNRGHVQEWALPELLDWLTDCGLRVQSGRYTRSNDHEPALATCLVVATA